VKSALLVIDVQQSFTRRPYWSQGELPPFLDRMQRLIDRCVAAEVPVLQVFHSEEAEGPQGAFSRSSGLVRTLPQLEVKPTAVFYKSVHSAMFARDASGVSVDDWLRRHGIRRVIVSGIRTEQCCETTARHASDLGYAVTYALDATLTFAMMSGSGRLYTPSEIKERTELVLAGRFAQVLPVEAVTLGSAE
jgi:nicotinamidase-related amidase